MKTRALSSEVALVILALSPAMGAAQPPAGQTHAGQNVTLSGTLQFLWGDPFPLVGGRPQMRYVLFGDDGVTRELRADPRWIDNAGGAWALNWQRVVVRGQVLDDFHSSIAVQSLALEREADRDNAERFRVSGSQAYVWILLRFADDDSTPETPAWFETQALGPHPSLDHYWREASFNNINLLGSDVVGWYDLPHDRSHYVYDIKPEEPGDELDFWLVLEDAVAVANADVYFPDFIGINLIFNGELDGPAWGGGSTVTADGATRWYGVTWMPPWGWRTQGVLAHEMGHALSLPHSSGPYDEVYDSQWDVMSGAFGTCAQSDPVYGCLGTNTIGYHKDWLSWIPAERRYVVGTSPAVTTLILYDLAVVPPAGAFHYVRIPSGADSFYTVERRRWTGYDQNVPAEAVVLHHIDYAIDDHARVVDPDDNGDCNDEGARWRPGETFYDSAGSVLISVNWANTNASQITFTRTVRSPVYVDRAASGYEDGSQTDPWNTVREGGGSVIPGGTVYIKPGTYPEAIILSNPATLRRDGTSGVATIGA